MDKVAIFKKEYSYIKDINIKKDLKYLVSILPDYFFEIPASSTGKYHPSFSLGEGGLVRHTKVAVRIAHELLITETFGQAFTEHEKDLIIMALVLHDGVKCGIPESKFTRADHPLLVSKLIMENKDKLKTVLYNLIESIRIGAILLLPFIPDTANEILRQINTKNKTLDTITFGSLETDIHINDFKPIFMRVEKDEK